MRIASTLAGAAVALAILAPVTPASAAFTVPNMSGATQSQVEPAHYTGYWHTHRLGRCLRWREICADRWGWGTWRYRRCLRLHGC